MILDTSRNKIYPDKILYSNKNYFSNRDRVNVQKLKFREKLLAPFWIYA